MTRKVPQIVKDWCASIKERTPQLMSSFYSNNAVLLATYETMAVGKREINNYFIDFLDKKNLRCRITDNISLIDDDKDTMVCNGLYIFSFVDDYGKKQEVNARYTFVINGGYIITHHSSVNPKEE